MTRVPEVRPPATPTSGGSDDEHDTRMTGLYVGVLVLEAAIIAALWVLGRIYS